MNPPAPTTRKTIPKIIAKVRVFMKPSPCRFFVGYADIRALGLTAITAP
jgi:hypothetical protein